jgi:hypothetical protein
MTAIEVHMKQLTFVTLAIGLVAALALPTVHAQQTGTAAPHVHAGVAQTADTHTATAPKPRWEFLVASGTVVPTGAQRGAIKRGNFNAAQLHFVVRPNLAISATLGWARSRDVASVEQPNLDIFTYDLGAEVRPARWTVGRKLTFMPFVGGGFGARSYNHRNLASDATHNVAGYLGVGGEVGIGRIRLRLEVRDYLTGFTPLRGEGARRGRNDVAVIFGIRLVSR